MIPPPMSPYGGPNELIQEFGATGSDPFCQFRKPLSLERRRLFWKCAKDVTGFLGIRFDEVASFHGLGAELHLLVEFVDGVNLIGRKS